MKNRRNFTKRRIFLAGGIVTAIGLAQPFAKFAKSLIKNDVSEMPGEYSMLKNIEHRRNILKSKQLVIRSAIFNERIADVICENTIFSESEFESDSALHIKQLTNVRFERCLFKDSRISSGVCKNVHFLHCTGQGKFMILADKGSEDILFEECEFSGPPAKPGAAHENDFATVGSLGSAVFKNCKLTFLRITGESSLTLEDSHLRKIDASTMRQGGNLYLKTVEVEGYIDFQMGVFSKFFVSHSKFAYMNLEKINSKIVLVEDCTRHAVDGDDKKKQYGFALETMRPVPSPAQPRIHVEMDSGQPDIAGNLLGNSLSDADAITIWDVASKSIRSRLSGAGR